MPINTIEVPKQINIDGVGTVSAGINFTGGLSLSANREAGIQLFIKSGLQSIGLYNDPLKLFSVSNDIVSGRAMFMNIMAASFGLRPANGCNWDPAARVFIDNEGIKMYSLTYQFEQCYDEFIGSCLRQLLGKGNSIQDILATEDGQRLLETAFAAVYEGALTDGDIMAWIARHPLIATAYNNGVSGMDADEFDRFYAQNGTNRVPEGWLAQIDNARISGIPNLNGHINPIDVHGNDFVGDGIAVLNNLKSNATSKLRVAISKNPADGVYFVSRTLFERIKVQLGDSCCSDELIKAKLLGDNANIGWTREHIMYNGLYVVPVDAWDVLNEATATNAVRSLLTVKGNLGAAFDVSKTTGGSPDIAFEAEQRLGPGDGFMGKVYGHANYELGIGILNRDYLSYASYVSA